MRILFLSTSMGMGGADRQLMSGAQGLKDRGHAVRIVSLTALGPMGHEANDLGLPTESLRMARGVPDPRGLARLVRIVRTWRPDVIHSHMVHANLMARALRVLVRRPALVSTIHNIYEGGAVPMLAYRATNGLVDHMTIVSQAAADRFVGERIVPASLLSVVPNGVDTEHFRRVAPTARAEVRRGLGLGEAFVWLAVGRFETAKDYPTMLQAFARLRASQPECLLLLVGKGSLQIETEAESRRLGLDGAVRFAGVRQDVAEVMAAADAYVMSSAWEGMPMVLLEAASAGLPIVATAVGGNAEVVRDRDTGFVVPPRDPGALAQGMAQVMALAPDERRAMGERGSELVSRRYGLHRVVDRWEEVYRAVLQRRGPAVDEASGNGAGAVSGGRARD